MYEVIIQHGLDYRTQASFETWEEAFGFLENTLVIVAGTVRVLGGDAYPIVMALEAVREEESENRIEGGAPGIAWSLGRD